MKKSILKSCLFCAFFAFHGCGNAGENSNKDSIDSAHKVNDSSMKKPDSISASTPLPVDNMTTNFAVNAASGGMTEVALGQIAQQKAVNQRVKDFGAMMVQDHTQANNDLKKRAAVLNITLPAVPGADDQKMIDRLSKKSGKDFDKSYMEMMLQDHKKDIAEFRNAADKCNNSSIKDFATQALPVLQKHLDSAQAITGNQ